MIIHKLKERFGSICLLARYVELALVASLFTLASTAFSAAPPANTKITNQATATYTDSVNTQRTVTSNAVVSSVSQVGAFTFSAGNSLGGSTGNTVYASHLLTNTGNGSDVFDISVVDNKASATFSSIAIYSDPNGTGQPAPNSSPLCSTSTTACTTFFKQTIASGSAFRFVVAYTLPTTATSASWPVDTATVTAAVDSTSPVPSTYSPSTLTSTDTVTFSNVASFSANTTIATPNVNAPGNTSWIVGAVNTGYSSAATGCSTTYSTTLTSSLICTYTVYTINYSNSGSSSGTFSLVDSLPSGLTYVTGSSVWSNNPGVALADSGTGNPSGISFTATLGGVISAQVSGVGANVSGSISFIALVNSNATYGGTNANNTVLFSPSTCLGTAAACATSSSNTTPFVVKQTFGVVLANAKSTVSDVSNGTAGTPNKSGIDLVLKASSAPGTTVSFTQYITNTGNSTDNFALTISGNTFPIGTTFNLYQADGQTPITSSISGYQYTTGPISTGTANSFTVIVKASIPASAIATSTPSFLLLTATSTGAANAGATVVPDAVWDQLSSITGSLMDLTNSASGTSCASSSTSCDMGPGPSTAPTVTQSTVAGTGTNFNLYIVNNDTVANTYTFSYSNTASFSGNLPAGWTVSFLASGTCTSGTALSGPLAVAAGAQASVIACVTPPPNATIGTQDVYFKATAVSVASSGVVLSDTTYDSVNVTILKTYTLSLSPTNNSGQGAAGSTYVYAHTLTNTGSQSCGSTGGFNVVATVPAIDAANGWSASVYLDTDNVGVINKNSTLITQNGQLGTLAAGANVKLLVKVFISSGTLVGASDAATLTITDNTPSPSACPVQTSVDTTTVVASGVALLKYQALDVNCTGAVVPVQGAVGLVQLTVAPGACVNYTVVATNQGASNVTNLLLSDSAPAHTTIATIQPVTPCSFTGTGTFTSVLTSTAASCSGANTLPPGGIATMNLSVKVNN